MSKLGQAIGLLTLINVAFPHEPDPKERDADCIQLCRNCKKNGGDRYHGQLAKSGETPCFTCPLYEYSFMTGEEK